MPLGMIGRLSWIKLKQSQRLRLHKLSEEEKARALHDEARNRNLRPGTGRRKRRSAKNTPEPLARPLTRNGPEFPDRGKVLCWEDGVYRRFSKRGLSLQSDPDLVVYTTQEGDILFYEIHARLKRHNHPSPSLQEALNMPDMTLSRISKRITIGRIAR